jgi:predicted DNA-binding protein (MmcQ/YjbR family)
VSGAEKDPLYELCRSLPGVTEDVKWGDNLVFSVGLKMFAVFNVPMGVPFSFKVDLEMFALLTQQPGIRPAPYLARHSWISVESRDTLPTEVVEDLLEDAHALVAAKLPRRVRDGLGL